MSAQDTPAVRRPGINWGRAEFILVGLGILGFLALPIRVTTIYGGLPAHPLFIHVPVILIPTTVVTGVVFMARPLWLGRWGIALCLVSIVAMSSIFLAMQAGGALEFHGVGSGDHVLGEPVAHEAAAARQKAPRLGDKLVIVLAAYLIGAGTGTAFDLVEQAWPCSCFEI